MNEIWKAIPGWEGLYEVSDHGNVRSLDRLTEPYLNSRRHTIYGRILKFKYAKDKRPRVCLSQKPKRQKDYIVSSLVALAFIGPRPDKFEVCHNDGNSANNCLSNLRYASHIENEADKKLHGTDSRGTRNGQCILSEDQVISIFNMTGISHSKIAELFNTTRSNVGAIKTGRNWSHLTSREKERKNI